MTQLVAISLIKKIFLFSDVAKKLEILDRRTQRAIAEIIRERLRSNQGQVDLNAVNTVGYSTQVSKLA